MLAKVHSAQVVGLKADIIDVEVDIARGLHSFTIVGLPDKAVEEARDRISAAIKNSGFPSPQKGNKKVIVSLAPADLKKEGPVFDAAIAIAHLLASGDITFKPEKKLFLGELSLEGLFRPIRGALLLAKQAAAAGFEEIYLPSANAAEAAFIENIKVFPCANLRDLASHLSAIKSEDGKPVIKIEPVPSSIMEIADEDLSINDFADVRGQETAKRGLEIAAAGGHNIALAGPPGVGKTMLAKAFTGILPPLTLDAALEVTGIHSARGLLSDEKTVLMTRPPFRSPHHTSSYVSLVGGGAWPKPGEITLAHRGVLFLDEFPEFDKRVIEALRQPLEDRLISVSRQRGSVTFPASFMLVAAMNPCPCGSKGVVGKECVCNQNALLRYQRKISGPIVDRIDLWIDVPQIDHDKLSRREPTGESSATIAARVRAARARQTRRYANQTFKTNSELSAKDLKTFAPLTETSTKLLVDAAKRLDLSARAYHRIIKLARTIADLENVPDIKDSHLLEALQYRPRT